jgi:hypothetical protein
MDVKLFSVDGSYICTLSFNGNPMVGDVLLVNERLMEITSRRWTTAGELELILDEVSVG